MSRLGRLFRSRITLALLGIAVVGGGGAYWAVASGASTPRQASNSLIHQDSTSTASAEDPTTTTTDPGATATTPPTRPTSTPRPTATPCLTPTPVPTGQSVHWQGRIVSVNTVASSFVLRVGCARPTIAVDSNTTWTGAVTSFAALRAGANAVILATRQSNGSYLANSVNAQNDN